MIWPLPAITAAATIAGTIGYGIASRSSQLFGPSVYRGPGRRHSIALTFDDGPSEATLHLLDYLARHNVPATFFLCGANVRRHPAIARAIRDAGHEIGNHTDTHPCLSPRWPHQFTGKSPAVIDREFSIAQQTITAETGVTPSLLRVPYGLRWFGLRAVQQRLHLLGVLWTVIGHDWEWPANRISQFVLQRTSSGGILCLHDGREIQLNPDVSEMLKAITRIIPALKDQGYSFETVTHLLRPDSAVPGITIQSE